MDSRSRDSGIYEEYQELNMRRLETMLGDKYQFLRTIHLHDGTLDQVHVLMQYAIDEKNNTRHEMREVIFKEISPAIHSEDSDVALDQQKQEAFVRFERELEMLKQLSQDPFVVTIYDLVRNPETRRVAGVILEKVDGGSLKEAIDNRERAANEPGEYIFPEADIARIGYCVTRALAAVHRFGLVHRDVKPQNVLLEKNGMAKLIDFNITRAQKNEDIDFLRQVDFTQREEISDSFSSELTMVGSTYGTPAYISPEQASGGTSLGALSDLYNLGATLYHMRTGMSPFGNIKDPEQLLLSQVHTKPKIPSTLMGDEALQIDTVIMTLLEKNPRNRARIRLPDGKTFRMKKTEDLAEVFAYIAKLSDPTVESRIPYSL